ncbi:MAG: hypothetical protein AAFX85_20045 [Pseudomonadota bacterium]
MGSTCCEKDERTPAHATFRNRPAPRSQELAGLLVLAAWLTMSLPALAFRDECPRNGSTELIAAPSEWADGCFEAIHGRLPDPSHIGESTTLLRDLDLAGRGDELGRSVAWAFVAKRQRGQTHRQPCSQH